MSAVSRTLASLVACSALLVPAVALAQPAAQPAPAPVAPAQAPAVKVAIVDTQKVLRETEEGMRIESNLRKLFDSKQADLLNKEKQLGAEYEELTKEEKQKGGKPDANLERKKNDFKQRYGAYQQAAVEFQREFQRKQNELYNPMLQKVYAIVKAIAQSESFEAVIDKQAAVWFRKDLDITERVIQAYNAGDSGPKAERPAEQPQPKPKAPKPKKK